MKNKIIIKYNYQKTLFFKFPIFDLFLFNEFPVRVMNQGENVSQKKMRLRERDGDESNVTTLNEQQLMYNITRIT